MTKSKRVYVAIATVLWVTILTVASTIFTLLISDILDKTTADNEVIWVVAGVFSATILACGGGYALYKHYRNK